MASVSEWIVKEYFEWLGYLLVQPCKYITLARHQRVEEDIDLIIHNPRVTEPRLPESLLWTTADLKGVVAAAVGVYGWHTDRFYPATLENLPEIVRFASPESIAMVSRRLGTPHVAKILCLSQLPASEKLRQELLHNLKQKGVNGILLFRTMLLELMHSVDTNKNYEKSDLLQIIRILKNYDLLRTPQLELFTARKRKTQSKRLPPPEPSPGSDKEP